MTGLGVAGGGPGDPRGFEPIVVSDEATVVAEFVPDSKKSSGYQSEADLEKSFISMLQSQAYEYLNLTSEEQLVANLRTQIETLNKIAFSDEEWERFFASSIAGANEGIVEKTRRIQQDHVQVLKRDDGSTKNISLIDKSNIHNNRLQVINQYEAEGKHQNRYDVTILVNGLPMVHVELKKRGVLLREAFNQIDRYQRDSFWADSGLFQYVQLFVISNGTLTKYYSNTTRESHIERKRSGHSKKMTSNSYEFTSWWADANNKPIRDLEGFTKTFFAKHSLLNVLTKYCVFDTDSKLLVMRPYQIVAAERILQRIETSTNYKKLGTVAAGGYVWHTTGSGKTLTSFKAAQLASQLSSVGKVLFVVDRKDLDHQTVKEYDRFEKGSANSNASTSVLKKQIEDPNARIIVTTIQKLSRFVSQNKGHVIYDGHVVLIFDECHRSQFGDMHVGITKAFKNYNLFGFTGTPIFAENSGSGRNVKLRTTEQAFGDRLHTYTIVDAIQDANVLPFRVDYNNTIKIAPGVVDKQVSAIDTEKALLSHERMTQVVDYILDHFDQKTKRNSGYMVAGKKLYGFNSLFATASIEAAKRYYEVFKQAQASRAQEMAGYRPLKIATIFSFAANEEEPEGFLDEEGFDTENLDQPSRDFLDGAIDDYNAMFNTNFDTSSDGFSGYYQDISRRLKDRDLDLVIVVNMFLTGFDATTLNTLWVDKNLRQHGLIQAFSRTNRILNSVKAYGNIVCFRDLYEATNDALALFGNKDAAGIVLLKPYKEYYDEYSAKVTEIQQFEPPIVGEKAKKQFVEVFGSILRLRNILTAFDEFSGDTLLSPRELQDLQSEYLDIYHSMRKAEAADKEIINQDVLFEIELIKQVEINVDYVLELVEEFAKLKGAGGDKEIEAQDKIRRAIDSSFGLRNKTDLIIEFVDSINVDSNVRGNWETFIAQKRRDELNAIIEEERLDPAKTEKFLANAFRSGELSTAGTALTDILPPVSKFTPENHHFQIKHRVINKLSEYFDRYFTIS